MTKRTKESVILTVCCTYFSYLTLVKQNALSSAQ